MSFKNEDEEMLSQVDKLGKAMGLQQHSNVIHLILLVFFFFFARLCCISAFSDANTCVSVVTRYQVAVYGPGDLEGHVGFDGRRYLVDCARLLPPEAPVYVVLTSYLREMMYE